jgi:hypothetical protein
MKPFEMGEDCSEMVCKDGCCIGSSRAVNCASAAEGRALAVRCDGTDLRTVLEVVEGFGEDLSFL